MSGSFLALALIAAVMIAFWRVTLLVAAALLVAMLFMGMSYVTDVVDHASTSGPSLLLPGSASNEITQPH